MIRGLARAAVTVGLALGTLLAPLPQPAHAWTPQPPRAGAPQRASAPMGEPVPRMTRALNIPSPVCTVAGWLSGLAGTLCSVARKGGELLSAGGTLVGGAGTAAKVVSVAAVLAGLTAWVTTAGHAILTATAGVIAATTRPQLESSWFSTSYWRMAAIGLLLTLPFLFAACVQGLLRSDPSLIGRAALGYLPLAVLGISITAPLTTLLLSASDGLSTLIAGAAGEAPGAALGKLGIGTALLAGASRSTFIAFVIGLVTVAATLTLWVELLIRAAAVYVIVLMLPVVFAALVWPARRVWAIRSAETLVALILAKFAIVAVLTLGGAAIAHGVSPGPAAPLVGVTLVLLAAFSPWALLRLLPLHEMAAGVGGLSPGLSRPMSMLDGPAPPAGGDRPASQDSPAADAGTDAAREIVRGLDGGHAAAGEVGQTGEAPGTGTGVTGEVANSADQTGQTDAADPVLPATDVADAADPVLPGTGVLVAPGATEAPGAPGSPDAGTGVGERERLPGMGPRWQAGNNSWTPLVLGPESLTQDAGDREPATDPLPRVPPPLPPERSPSLERIAPPDPEAGER